MRNTPHSYRHYKLDEHVITYPMGKYYQKGCVKKWKRKRWLCRQGIHVCEN